MHIAVDKDDFVIEQENETVWAAVVSQGGRTRRSGRGREAVERASDAEDAVCVDAEHRRAERSDVLRADISTNVSSAINPAGIKGKGSGSCAVAGDVVEDGTQGVGQFLGSATAGRDSEGESFSSATKAFECSEGVTCLSSEAQFCGKDESTKEREAAAEQRKKGRRAREKQKKRKVKEGKTSEEDEPQQLGKPAGEEKKEGNEEKLGLDEELVTQAELERQELELEELVKQAELGRKELGLEELVKQAELGRKEPSGLVEQAELGRQELGPEERGSVVMEKPKIVTFFPQLVSLPNLPEFHAKSSAALVYRWRSLVTQAVAGNRLAVSERAKTLSIKDVCSGVLQLPMLQQAFEIAQLHLTRELISRSQALEFVEQALKCHSFEV